MRKCPFCAEEIQDAAIKCRYCGSMLDQPAVANAAHRGKKVDAMPRVQSPEIPVVTASDKSKVQPPVRHNGLGPVILWVCGLLPFVVFGLIRGILNSSTSHMLIQFGALCLLAGLYFALGVLLPSLPFVRRRSRAALFALLSVIGAGMSGAAGKATMSPAERQVAQAQERHRQEQAAMKKAAAIPKGPPTREAIQTCVKTRSFSIGERVYKATTREELAQLSAEVAGLEVACTAALYAQAGLSAPEAPEDTHLQATVTFTGTQFEIANVGTVDWTNVKFDVNGGLVTSGYVLRLGELKAMSEYTVGAMQFADSHGTRFNPFQMKPQSMTISATLPSGSTGIRIVDFR